MRKVAIIATSLALLLLLLYSLERSAWLFARYELDTQLALAAAVVVELAAVALIIGASALTRIDPSARAWANRALLAVLSVQALANLSAGYLRGGQNTLALFGGDGQAAYAVAAVLWLVTNLAVPGLVLCLSKLLERLLAAQKLTSAPEPQPTSAITITAPAPALSAPPKALPMAASAPKEAVTQDEERSVAALYLDDGSARWPCARCGAALFSARAVGASKTNKGCKECRGRER